MSDETKKMLIIDEDEVIHNVVSHQGKSLGFDQIDLFKEGPAGWHAAFGKKYDFIYFDWQVPNLSGIAIFSRIRQMGKYFITPVLVGSNVYYKKDFALLTEYPGSDFLEKPFSSRQFEKKVRNLTEECDWYDKNFQLIVKVLEKTENDKKIAYKSVMKIIEKSPHPLPIALIGIRKMFHSGFIDEAEELVQELLKKYPDHPALWNELGKIYNFRENVDKADDSFQKADKNAPNNLERLGLMGEVKLKKFDTKGAQEIFQQVLEIDPEDEKAKAGIFLASHLEAVLKEEKGKTSGTDSFASLLNMAAVSLVNKGEFIKGISQYEAALMFLSKNDERAKLMFNLGLAHLKNKDSVSALAWFTKAHELGIDGFDKPKQYMEKLKG